MHILRCMGSKFCVKFQGAPLKFHTKFWTHTSQNMHLTVLYFCVWVTVSLNCDVISISETCPRSLLVWPHLVRGTLALCSNKTLLWFALKFDQSKFRVPRNSTRRNSSKVEEWDAIIGGFVLHITFYQIYLYYAGRADLHCYVFTDVCFQCTDIDRSFY